MFIMREVMGLIANRITLEEAVRAFEHYDREQRVKIIVEPNRK